MGYGISDEDRHWYAMLAKAVSFGDDTLTCQNFTEGPEYIGPTVFVYRLTLKETPRRSRGQHSIIQVKSVDDSPDDPTAVCDWE